MTMYRCPRLSLLLLTLPGVCAPAFAFEQAPIRSVTVYAGTAVVERELRVEPGARHVEIGGLPTDFGIESLRLQSSDGVHAGQLSLRDEATVNQPDAREAALEDRIQALQDQKTALDVDAEAATTVKDLLGRLSLGSGGPHDGGTLAVDGRNLAGIVDEVRKGSTGALTTIRTVDLQKRTLDRQIEAAQRDLDKLRSGRRDTRILAFDLSAEQAGTLLISYPQNGAGWQPAYRAVLDSATGKLSLQRQALVQQRTGEDWSGIRLRLSTGQPKLAPSGPEPQPWMLRLQPPQDDARQMNEPVMAYAAAAPVPMHALKARAAPPPPPVIEFNSPFATEFSVPNPVNIPSDGSIATLALGDQSIDTSLRLRTTPRLEAAAFLEAEADIPPGDWLPGKVELVRDGDYVGSTEWNPQAHDKLELPFGRDDLVHVSYDRKQDRNAGAGLLGHRNTREVSDEFTIVSRHRTALPLLVLETTPVSTADEVKIDKDYSPKPDVQDWDSRNGVVAWQTSLQPDTKLTYRVDYDISYPEGQTVLGLP